MAGEYEAFIASKAREAAAVGFNPDREWSHLFPFQAALVTWACKRGRAAIFAGTGLGKTRMQLTWADEVRREGVRRHQPARVLILAPLAVAAQTTREAETIGIDVVHDREGTSDAPIVVTNYEKIARFDLSKFGGVVLDESSILKSHDGRTRQLIIDAFSKTPYKLACTATPAPNDHEELGNHAEFLSVMSRTEMLATFFCHDGGETQKWRLKGHARGEFWRWMSSWGAMVRSPADLGFADDAYALPPLRLHEQMVTVEDETMRADGFLFAQQARTLSDRRSARRLSMSERVTAAAGIANASAEQCLVWCDLNAEGDALAKAIDGAVQVAGADDPQHKEDAMIGFAEGRVRVLVTKPSIAGFGMNWQNCHRMIFVGLSDSWEQYYQAIRRCWRFGQTSPVDVHVVTSHLEGAVVANIRRKEADAKTMSDEMSVHTRNYVMANVRGSARETLAYQPITRMTVPKWIGREAS